jgi:hypothetical protein
MSMVKKGFDRVLCLALALAAALAFGLWGCGKKPAEPPAAVEEEEKSGEHGGSATDTGDKMLSGGTSPYRIALSPGDASAAAASGELAYFLRLASGHAFEVVEDGGLEYSPDGRYISLGNTALLRGSGIAVDDAKLGDSGYLIKTVGKSVFITGASSGLSFGTLYGAYDFLERVVGYRAYAADEIALSYAAEIPLYDFDILDIPDIGIRAAGFKQVIADGNYKSRMRLVDYADSRYWVMFGHNQIDFVLPKSMYMEEHPDWYSPDGRTLELTSDGMTAEFVERAKGFIRNNPNAPYIMFGQPDTTGFSQSAASKEAVKTYGTEGGVQIVWLNKVAKALDEWLAAEYPGKKMTYVTFAYNATEAAPVKSVGKGADGRDIYEPFHPDAVPRENVGILYAPIGMDFSRNIYETRNESSAASFLGWNALTENVFIWSYCTNFSNYFYNFNNFGALPETYKIFFQSGVKYVFDQGPVNAVTPAFAEMRIFTQSRLLWDTSLDPEVLRDDFMEHYFKGAAPALRSYYDLLATWHAVLDKEQGVATGNIYAALDRPQYWPKSLLDQFQGCFDRAYAALSGLKASDPALYEKLYNRVRKEQLSVDFILYSFYRSYFAEGDLNERLNEFDRYTNLFNIDRAGEGELLFGVTSNWR